MKELTCIGCPRGCTLKIEKAGSSTPLRPARRKVMPPS